MGTKTLESCEQLNAGYAEVHLTELETAQALYEARMRKYYALESLHEQEQKRRAFAEMQRKWNHEDMKQYVLKASAVRCGYSANGGLDGNPVFTIDGHNERIFHLLCLYFTGDAAFESETDHNGKAYSLDKGIFLMGNVGRGKTDMMRVFAGNQRQSFVVTSTREVSKLFAIDGHISLDAFSDVRHMVAGDTRVFNQRILGYCFDDLGTEEQKQNFGNKMNVMAEIIQNRYDARNRMPFYFTHLTTNLNAEEIEQYYGTRVRSRMRDMFNVIRMEGNDRRG